MNRKCQAEKCSLPPSSLPWRLDVDGVAIFEFELCHEHGALLEALEARLAVAKPLLEATA